MVFSDTECGHEMVCYSLEPTPLSCPDCADKGRKLLDGLIRDVDGNRIDEVPDSDGVDEWLDEEGVTGQLRADVKRLVDYVDDARSSLDRVYFEGRRMLEKYPPAERLVMPREGADA